MLAVVSQDPLFVGILINISLVGVMVINRKDINIVSLCLGFLIVKVIERALFSHFIVTESDTMSAMWVNAIIFSVHFIVDLTLFFMVMLRAPVTRGCLTALNKPIDKVCIYKAEMAFVGLFLVFMFVDLVALLENFIRHLDELGFSDDFVGHFSGWNWVYYQYEHLKIILTSLSFLLLWSMTMETGRDAYKTADAH